MIWEKLNHSFPANNLHVFPKVHLVICGVISLPTGGQPGLTPFGPGQVSHTLNPKTSEMT